MFNAGSAPQLGHCRENVLHPGADLIRIRVDVGRITAPQVVEAK